jgi:hypothetical protein
MLFLGLPQPRGNWLGAGVGQGAAALGLFLGTLQGLVSGFSSLGSSLVEWWAGEVQGMESHLGSLALTHSEKYRVGRKALRRQDPRTPGGRRYRPH